MDPQPRVVSLIASATEIVAALGCQDWLVGRSHECDYPPSVLCLPACSSPKFDIHGDSREIDARVKSVLLTATSVYNVDVALLNALAPTVIVTQTQCEVCAVSLKDVERAVCEVVSSRPDIVSLAPNSLADIWEDFRRVGIALGVEARAETLIATLQTRLRDLKTRCEGLARARGSRPRVACIEWQEPLMAGGNWVPELVSLVGGENLFGEAGQHSPWMTWEDLVAADPDCVIVMPCGFDIARTSAEMHWLTDRPDWPALRAVSEGHVYVTDGNQYFNRPGPRVVESAEILAEIFYPGDGAWGHEGLGWVRWTK